MEFNSANFAILTLEHFFRIQKGHKFAALVFGGIGLFGNGAHILNTFAKGNKDATRAASNGRGGTVESGITGTKNDYITMELGQLTLA